MASFCVVIALAHMEKLRLRVSAFLWLAETNLTLLYSTQGWPGYLAVSLLLSEMLSRPFMPPYLDSHFLFSQKPSLHTCSHPFFIYCVQSTEYWPYLLASPSALELPELVIYFCVPLTL